MVIFPVMFRRVLPWIWLVYASIRYPDWGPYLLVIALGVAAIWHVGRLARQPRPSSAPVASDPGILFLESAESLPSDSRCLICRQALAGDVIYCVKCHTPHHRECFRYLGSCSVYACRNRAA